MTTILARSDTEIQRIKSLLNEGPPNSRKAYSDRTAWIMSCLSELAYIRFNPPFKNEYIRKLLIENIERYADQQKAEILNRLIDIGGYDPEEEKKKLLEELGLIKIELINTYDEKGTQAILVSMGDYLVLAFRGTEATSLKDVKSDMNAKIKPCVSGGKVHSGFSDSFDLVCDQIQETLGQENYNKLPLFITGHSLGGALATVAAKRIDHPGGKAACYTFGSPRVGDEEWLSTIKTPVYRLVNAADSVTMLPPGSLMIDALSWLVDQIPVIGETFGKKLRGNFSGYLHCGNMRYLTNCKPNDYSDVRLLYSVNLIYRIKGLLLRGLPWRRFLADHSISVYRAKLTEIAVIRNPELFSSN